MKSITILGSTGSIGTQALSIIRDNPDKYCTNALSCSSSIDVLAEQIREFHPPYAVTARKADAERLQEAFPQTEFHWGDEGLNFIGAETECDVVLNSLVGIRGLEPTYKAILAGKDIALANKETLVTGGRLITEAVRKKGVKLLPVDSEHSAVFQCLQGIGKGQVRRVILTASGGPFRGRTFEELESVTVEQALNHPNWSMGRKITIDSATMMNKGLEVIEARWLFDMPPEKIDVVVHPQSIIHSMVEYEDRAVMAQLGTPDMKIPISLAFAYPERLANTMEALDLTAAGTLTFEKPDLSAFPCLAYAYEALQAGDSYCTAVNAADEVMAAAFLAGRIGFNDISRGIKNIMDAHVPVDNTSLESILETDKISRKISEKFLEKF